MIPTNSIRSINVATINPGPPIIIYIVRGNPKGIIPRTIHYI